MCLGVSLASDHPLPHLPRAEAGRPALSVLPLAEREDRTAERSWIEIHPSAS